MPKLKPGHVSPTPGEDYAINAAVAADPEASELGDDWFERARPASEVVPNIVRRYRRTRGKQRAPTKTQITLRLDADLVLHFRETGKGWQTRMNDTLREAVFEDE
ncbi:MAG: BrnA antitoxin family protein [Chloroflexi bacterium]|nr:BrnA antitoxin family protein [Chloroflexota bacterium]